MPTTDAAPPPLETISYQSEGYDVWPRIVRAAGVLAIVYGALRVAGPLVQVVAGWSMGAITGPGGGLLIVGYLLFVFGAGVVCVVAGVIARTQPGRAVPFLLWGGLLALAAAAIEPVISVVQLLRFAGSFPRGQLAYQLGYVLLHAAGNALVPAVLAYLATRPEVKAMR